MKIFGNSFQRLCWRIKREMSKNRKPILFLFGNGYDSQILLAVLLKLKKKFMIIHNANNVSPKKVNRVLSKARQKTLILRPYEEEKTYKTFSHDKAFCFEKLNFGFSSEDYFIIAGFKISEPSLIKGYFNGLFKTLYCPLLLYSDEWIQTLYQDMKDNEKIGEFLFENLTSDSHHNIAII